MIYLIEKAWSDPIENAVDAAFGYAPYAYTESEEEAKEICSKSRILDKKFCWAVYGNPREMIYKSIPSFKSLLKVKD